MDLVSEEHLLEKSIGGHDWNLASSIQSNPGKMLVMRSELNCIVCVYLVSDILCHTFVLEGLRTLNTI